MKLKWIWATDVSGSVAGITGSTAKGGVTYLRERKSPTNPNTFRQQVVRAAMSALSSAWKTVLSPTERNTWIALADGQAANGLSLFNKGNIARRQVSMDDVLDYDELLAENPIVADAVTNSGGAISITWTGDGAEDVDGAAMIFYIQQPTPPSVTNNERYRLLGSVQGDSVAAPTSPFTGASPWGNSPTVGYSSKIRVMWTDPSGRYVQTQELEHVYV